MPTSAADSSTVHDTDVEELLETLVRLVPGSRLVTVGAGSAAPRTAHRVLVPGRRGPTALSTTRPRALAEAHRAVDATTTPGDAMGLLGTRAWTSLTAGQLLRERVAVVGGTDGLADHLSEVLGQRVTYTMRIEEARTSRRPVLSVLDARDRRVARADLGVSPASRSDLDAEVAALAQVGTREWTHLEVPRVLSRTSWDDIDVLVTSTLRAPLWQGGARRRAEPPVEAMGELSTAWAEPAVRLEEMGWMRRQQDLVDMLRSRTARQRFGAVVDRLLHDARRTTWPVGAWHGDWTAHHMARRGPQVQVWGWTRFETGVPMGLDPCHFLVSAATDRDGFTPSAVRAGLAEALRRQHGPGASVLGALYLLAVTSRELVLAEGPGGHRVAERAEVLLTTLEDWFTSRV